MEYTPRNLRLFPFSCTHGEKLKKNMNIFYELSDFECPQESRFLWVVQERDSVLEVKHSLVFSEHERVVCREEHQAVEWILWRQASPMSTAGFECSLFAAELVDGLEDDWGCEDERVHLRRESVGECTVDVSGQTFIVCLSEWWCVSVCGSRARYSEFCTNV